MEVTISAGVSSNDVANDLSDDSIIENFAKADGNIIDLGVDAGVLNGVDVSATIWKEDKKEYEHNER